jgi:hypothetical protein
VRGVGAGSTYGLCPDREVPLGKYWRSSPLVFLLLPRCPGECIIRVDCAIRSPSRSAPGCVAFTRLGRRLCDGVRSRREWRWPKRGTADLARSGALPCLGGLPFPRLRWSAPGSLPAG